MSGEPLPWGPRRGEYPPWAGAWRVGGLLLQSLMETSGLGQLVSRESLVSLQSNNSFDVTPYVANSFLSFVYLDSFI